MAERGGVLRIDQAKLCPDCDVLTESTTCPVCGRDQTMQLRSTTRSGQRWPWMRENDARTGRPPAGPLVEQACERHHALLEAAREVVEDLPRLVATAEALVCEYEHLRARAESLNQLQDELRRSKNALSQATHELDELRETHRILTQEHDTTIQTVRDLREQEERAERDRVLVVQQLEAAIGRLQRR